MQNKAFHLYILYSPKIDRFYIGVTSNLEWRIKQHNKGLSPYTRGKGPWYLVYSEEYPTKREALARERQIKSWKSREKIIREFGIDLELLNRQSGPVPSDNGTG